MMLTLKGEQHLLNLIQSIRHGLHGVRSHRDHGRRNGSHSRRSGTAL